MVDNNKIQQQLKSYQNAKNNAESNSNFKKFLENNQTGENAKIQEGVTNELIFYDTFMSSLPKNDNLDEQLEFLDGLQKLNKNVFGKEINVHDKIDHLMMNSFDEVKKSNNGTQNSNAISNQNNKIKADDKKIKPVNSVDVIYNNNEIYSNKNNNDYESNSKSNNQADYRVGTFGNNGNVLGLDDPINVYEKPQFNEDFNSRAKSQQKPVIPSQRSDKLPAYNAKTIGQLQGKTFKDELEELSYIENNKKNPASFNNPKKGTPQMHFSGKLSDLKEGNATIIKNQREQEIEEMRKKIDKLEAQNKNEFGSDLKKEESSLYRNNRTRSQIIDNGSHSSRIFRPKPTYVKNVEKSGSSFVNQMRKDINKMLFKGGGGGGNGMRASGIDLANSNMKSSNLVRSIYQNPYDY